LGYKEKMAEFFALPKEITLNLPLVTWVGRGELDIENYKGIVAYSETALRVKTKAGTLVAEGKRLELKQISAENLLLKGDIERVYYVS
jgi:sporulation protein YqfC